MILRIILATGYYTLIFLVGAGAAEAFTATPTGATFNAKYTEPTTNALGAPLTNLLNCTVTYRVAVDAGTPGPAKLVVVPASSPTGGQLIVRPITDTELTPGHNYTLTGSYACANPAGTGNSSAPAAPLAIGRAGEVPPGTPAAPLVLE